MGPPHRVLLLTDRPDNITNLLSAGGFEVTGPADEPDAIVLARATWSLNDLTGPVPVVVIVADDQSGRDALLLGAADYLLRRELTVALLGRSLMYVVERHRRELAEKQLAELTTAITKMREIISGLRDEIRGALVALAEVQKPFLPKEGE